MSDPLDGIPEHLKPLVHADQYGYWSGRLKHREREEFLAALQAEYDAGQTVKPVSDLDTPMPVPAPDKSAKPEDKRAEQGEQPQGEPTEQEQSPDPLEAQNIRLSIEDNLQEPQDISLQLQDDLHKMGDAVSSPAEPPQPPSTVKTVWAFIRKFAAVGGAFLLGASWTMLEIDEYGLALLLLVLGLGGLSIQLYDWKGIEEHSKATTFLKSVAAVLILVSLVYFSAVIIKRKTGKSWSNLLEPTKTMPQAPDSATEAGTPERFTRVPVTPTPRVLLNKTPRQLLALYEKGNTQLQADQLMEPFKGEWIRVTGTLRTLSPTESGVVATLEVKEGKFTDSVGASFKAVGGEAKRKFMRLTRGEAVTIEGKIARDQSGAFLYLIEAELITP